MHAKHANGDGLNDLSGLVIGRAFVVVGHAPAWPADAAAKRLVRAAKPGDQIGAKISRISRF
jgi:hypothetical protein